MRVVMIIDDVDGPAALEKAISGWGRYLTELRRWAPDVEVTIASLGPPSRFHTEIEAAGYGAVALERRGPYDVAGPVRRLVPVLQEQRAEIVHGHGVYESIVGGLAARRVGGVRSIYHRNHLSSRRKPKRVAASWLAARLADHTIAVSDAVVRSARRWDRTPADRVTRVHHGIGPLRSVERDEVERIRRDLGLRPDERVVVAVSRMSPEKGIDLFVRAIGELRRAPRPHAVVVGTGPDGASLRRLVAEIAPGRVHLVGYHADVAPWYALADVVVLPSRRDALPFVALEAMVAGRPVIATRVGGLPEAVEHGRTGLLVPPEQPGAMARAIVELLTDPDRAAAMGGAARERARTGFSQEAVIRGWLDVYRRTLAATTSGKRGS